MTPGPEVVISCPACKTLSRFSTISSGNTFGSTLWSDGYRHCPMLETPTPVIQCQACSKVFLKWKAEEIGKFSPYGGSFGFDDLDDEETPEEWKQAPKVQTPNEDDFYQAIDNGLPQNKKEEKNLRVTAWWQSNDRYRGDLLSTEKKNDEPVLKKREDNMKKLLGLMDKTNPNDQIMSAELFR